MSKLSSGVYQVYASVCMEGKASLNNLYVDKLLFLIWKIQEEICLLCQQPRGLQLIIKIIRYAPD